MKWGETETCKFVELYREQQCLWNVNNVHYRHRGMRLSAFQHIAKQMGIEGLTPTDVKLKIKNLRGTYNQELTKIARSTKTASSNNEIYIPNMRWFNIMDAFVRQIKEKRSSKDNLVPENSLVDEENEPEGIFPDNGPWAQQTATEPENLSVKTLVSNTHQNIQILQKSQIGPIITEVSAVDNHSSRKRRYDVLSSTDQDSQLSTNSTNEQGKDEMDVFGKFVALSLKKLSIPSAMSAQSEILSVLNRHRLNDYQSTVSCYSTSLSQSDSISHPTSPNTLTNIIPKVEKID